MQGMLTQVYRRSRGCTINDGRFLRSTESLYKLTYGPAEAWKDDGSRRKVVQTQRKLNEGSAAAWNFTEGPTAIRKVHGSPSTARKVA